MRAKLIQTFGEKTFAVVFDKGDEFAAGLLEFAKQERLDGASFTAIGAFSDATLGYFDRQKMDYTKIPVREQVEVLGTTLGCDLRRSDYHKVAEGYGGVGLVLTDPARVDATLAEAKAIAKGGRPVCINVHLRATDFRKGSISM